jgi:hypothetical protein
MPQIAYNFLMTVASAGTIYDLGFNNVMSFLTTVDQIFPGLGVGKVIGQDYQVQLPMLDNSALTISTALITGNSTVVTVNGVALAPIVFTGTAAATMALIAAAIAAQPNIQSSTVSGSGLIITTVASPGFSVSVTAVTTLGASQPTWAQVLTSLEYFYGVAIYIQNKQNLLGPMGSNGGAPYFPGDVVPTMTRGRVWVFPENTVSSDSPVYWRVVPTLLNPQVGSFRADADTGNAVLISGPGTGVRWILGSANTQGNLAVLEVNLP